LLAVFLASACAKGPSSAQSAFHALKRVEVKTIRVTPYEDFAEELGAAREAVNLHLSGEAAKREPKLASLLQDALFSYELSAKLWHILRQAGQSSVANNIKRVCIRRASAAGLELAAYLESLGALPPPKSDGCPYEEIEITRQMTFLWERASQQLRLAHRALEH
jgi:hypothetical protein